MRSANHDSRQVFSVGLSKEKAKESLARKANLTIKGEHAIQTHMGRDYHIVSPFRLKYAHRLNPSAVNVNGQLY